VNEVCPALFTHGEANQIEATSLLLASTSQRNPEHKGRLVKQAIEMMKSDPTQMQIDMKGLIEPLS